MSVSLRVESAVENVKILPTIMNVKTLKNPELVPRCSGGAIWKAVLNLNAQHLDQDIYSRTS